MAGKPSPSVGKNNLIRSFVCAVSGLLHALHHERNLRIDFSVGGLVLYFSRYYGLTRPERAALLMLVGFVITCELFNTAIENTVDLETSDYHSLARIAKDVAAGAVLVSAISSIAAGFYLFWEPETLLTIWRDVTSRLFLWIPLLVAILIWIFAPRKYRPNTTGDRNSCGPR